MSQCLFDRSNDYSFTWQWCLFLVSSVYNSAQRSTQIYTNIFSLSCCPQMTAVVDHTCQLLASAAQMKITFSHWKNQTIKLYWHLLASKETLKCLVCDRDKGAMMEYHIPTPHMLWQCFEALFGGEFSTLYSCLDAHIYQWLTSSVECQAPTWQEKPLYFWLLVQNQISFPPLCSGSSQAFMENTLCSCRQMPVYHEFDRIAEIILVIAPYFNISFLILKRE